jgi:streptomycin 6-kinase
VVEVPRGLVDATLRREGEAGRDWLERLQALVADACRRWHCVVDGEPLHGQVALVVPVRHPAAPAVLKVMPPSIDGVGEAAVLRALDGHRAVAVLESDEAGSVLVMERAGPETLADSITAEAGFRAGAEIAGDLARELSVAGPPGTTPLATLASAWAENLGRQVRTHPGALPSSAISRAAATIRALGADHTPTVLHGDLHFGNVLRSSRGWLAIDPQGWTGTAAFDAFTIATGSRLESVPESDRWGAVVQLVARFAHAAGVDTGLAMACCQARAVSAFLHQLGGPATFDPNVLRMLAQAGDGRM